MPDLGCPWNQAGGGSHVHAQLFELAVRPARALLSGEEMDLWAYTCRIGPPGARTEVLGDHAAYHLTEKLAQACAVGVAWTTFARLRASASDLRWCRAFRREPEAEDDCSAAAAEVRFSPWGGWTACACGVTDWNGHGNALLYATRDAAQRAAAALLLRLTDAALESIEAVAPQRERRPGLLLEGWVEGEGEGWAPVRIAGEDATFATPDEARAAANAIDDALPAWSDERTIYRALDLATGFARWEERHATGEGGWG